MNGLNRAGEDPALENCQRVQHGQARGQDSCRAGRPYEYGNDNLSVGTNYIRQVVPFTRELDKVSEELFKLTTRGGSESLRCRHPRGHRQP